MGLDIKYRPKIFDDVIGQEVPTTILRASVAKNAYSSAYLFEGPSGTGKTTCARIFAKSILCPTTVNGNPCGTCESCKSFDEERNFDYTEVDAASVGGKDDMVKLKDDAAFISVGRKKIIYLDECHDISRQGQDALLKQVEQCPPHLIYLFCTTEAEKLKPTLKKRCTKFQFSRVSPEHIFSRLKFICTAEGFSYEDEALRVIVDRSEGHVRDAVKLLEEVHQFGQINTESVSKIVVDYSDLIYEIVANLGINLPRTIEVSKELSSYLPVWDFYEQLVIMVTDAVKVIYGYEDFLPKRKALLIKLRDIHGCLLIEFMNYLISREKFVDRIGLTSDLILLHYKFCSGGFKPQVPILAQQNFQGSVVNTPLSEKPAEVSVTPSEVPIVKHAQLMSLPIPERIKLLQQQHSKKQVTVEDGNQQKIATDWSLPKDSKSDSSTIAHKELSPLEFSNLLVGGRGGI